VRRSDAGAVRFACPYAAAAITFRTTLASQPQRSQRGVIAIEAHDVDTHLRAHREIFCLPGREPMLGALSAVEDAADSRYANLLTAEPVTHIVIEEIMCNDNGLADFHLLV